MLNRHVLRIVDLGVFVIANIINLLLVVMFVVRTRAMTRETRVEYVVGLAVVAMALPLAAAVVVNVIGRREWWSWALPLVTIAYLILEFVLDHVLKADFRNSGLLTPYLILFYLGQFAMIGYSFGVGRPYGFITLVTYLFNLAATFYSYARVGHG